MFDIKLFTTLFRREELGDVDIQPARGIQYILTGM